VIPPARLDRRGNPVRERRPLDRDNVHTDAACHPRFPPLAKALLTRTVPQQPSRLRGRWQGISKGREEQ
jgi:hypothetical protein